VGLVYLFNLKNPCEFLQIYASVFEYHSSMRHFYLKMVVFFLLTAGLTLSCQAENVVVQYGYHEDKGSSITPAQLIRTEFSDSKHIINKPPGRHPHWIKLQIHSAHKDNLILRVKPSYLDHIELYQSNKNGVQHIKTLGDTHSGSLMESNDLAYRFKLYDVKESTYYLKIITSSNIYINVSVLEEKEADQLKFNDALIFGCGLGIMLLLAAFSLSFAYKNRDTLSFLLLTAIILGLISTTLRSGIIEYLIPSLFHFSPNLYTTASVGLSLVLFAQFLAEFIRKKINKIQWAKSISIINIFIVIYNIGYLIIEHEVSTPTLLLLGVLNFSLVSYIFFKTVALNDNLKIKIPGTILLILGAYSILLNAGFFGTHEFDFYILQFRNIGFYFFYVYLLWDLLKKESIEKNNLAIANQQKEYIAEKEKNRRNELEKIIGLLLHEIKTPLSVIQLAVDNLNTQAQNTDSQSFKKLKNIADSADQINSIITKSTELEKENHQIDLEKKKFNLFTLLSNAIQIRNLSRITLVCPANIYLVSNEFTFEIIVNNLIDNAIKHSEENSLINITANILGIDLARKVVITFENSISIHQKEIFISKFNSSHKIPSSNSSGLGLWLIHELSKTLDIKIKNEIHNQTVKFSVTVSQCFMKKD
jgi:two-component system, sensor histidine kinase LadS